jgi:hypothetical protein
MPPSKAPVLIIVTCSIVVGEIFKAALVRTTEWLLSPITLGQSLNEGERDMVAMCAQSLLEKYPRAETSSQEKLAC